MSSSYRVCGEPKVATHKAGVFEPDKSTARDPLEQVQVLAEHWGPTFNKGKALISAIRAYCAKHVRRWTGFNPVPPRA